MPFETKRPTSWWQRVVKRILDVVVSATAAVLLFPLLIYTAIRVRLSSPGPVLYSQERVGYQGRIFRILKFRSMYVEAESQGPQLSHQLDDRITPWGRMMRKWKIDELPQLWNVLAGEMSIVGPRPERAYYIEQLQKLDPSYKKLLTVKPGITSLGMVRYGYAGSLLQMIERMKFDLAYLEKPSLALDLRIIVQTLGLLLRPRG